MFDIMIPSDEHDTFSYKQTWWREFIVASCNQLLVEIFPQAFEAKAGYSDLSHSERVDIISTPAHVY